MHPCGRTRLLKAPGNAAAEGSFDKINMVFRIRLQSSRNVRTSESATTLAPEAWNTAGNSQKENDKPFAFFQRLFHVRPCRWWTSSSGHPSKNHGFSHVFTFFHIPAVRALFYRMFIGTVWPCICTHDMRHCCYCLNNTRLDTLYIYIYYIVILCVCLGLFPKCNY